MVESEFLALNQLFDSIGIIEKGIEKIYHFLLLNKRIDNLKKVCNQFNLTLKRGYKISSVLSDLELVQIYDRPMKIILQTPVIPVWQRIISNRIEELKNQFEEKKTYCESSFQKFNKIYDLKEEEVEQEPVEFINYSLDNLDDLYYPLYANKESKIATGIRYENILVSSIKNETIDGIQKKYKTPILECVKNISKNIKEISVRVIFNNDIVEILLNSREYRILTSLLETIDFEFKDFEIRITEEDFSNFSIVDDELIQPSFDPSNKLMGAYISRNKNIFQIFYDKFEELFKKGIPINEFVKNDDSLKVKSLSNFQNFVLCLL
ncbi:MAG: hypothetical protein GF317_10810 [Candidatus Lokiarchaeota archaeon]|nr:hypothetical protein [Candidatus Lokiarchaeota archaeon]MBD3200152.1 hypothetical protein [Candidatus Lokiarchaeota archaeon]